MGQIHTPSRQSLEVYIDHAFVSSMQGLLLFSILIL